MRARQLLVNVPKQQFLGVTTQNQRRRVGYERKRQRFANAGLAQTPIFTPLLIRSLCYVASEAEEINTGVK